MTTPFIEAQHARNLDGKFAAKANSEVEGGLSALTIDEAVNEPASTFEMPAPIFNGCKVTLGNGMTVPFAAGDETPPHCSGVTHADGGTTISYVRGRVAVAISYDRDGEIVTEMYRPLTGPDSAMASQVMRLREHVERQYSEKFQIPTLF